MKRRGKIVGYIEHVTDGIVRGWAWNPSTPKQHVCLDVFVCGAFAGHAHTGRFRQDILENGIGDGTHVFIFHLPKDLDYRKIDNEDVEIFTSGHPTVRLGKVTPEALIPPREENDVFFPESFFRGLIDRIATSTAPGRCENAVARRQIDLILAPAQDSAVSAFAAHIARKYARPLQGDADADFWSWYLGCYAIEKGDARAPLSTADIAAIAALRRDNAQTFLPKAARRLVDVYDWGADASRALFVEDCLVAPEESNALRQVPFLSRKSAFPLSRFMLQFHRRHPLLRAQMVSTQEDRIKVYALIMLFALCDVHYLAYLPSRWLRVMLEEAPGESHFVRAQKRLLGSERIIEPRTFIARTHGLGFDIDSQTFRGTAYDGHRVLGGSGVVNTGDMVDVQLIGPFRRSLGLSESCRRLAAALQRTSLSINFVDFDVGTASGRMTSELPLSQVRAARINILHLNAEEAPEAIAYLPDCFARSHTILMPYWELNQPAKVHDLGLSLADEIWAATDHLARGFQQRGRRVTHVGMCADDRPRVSYEEGRRFLAGHNLPSSGFVFLTTFDALSWAQRKNVLGVIDAFVAAFPSAGPSLIIKTRNAKSALSRSQHEIWAMIRARCEDHPRLSLFDADLDTREHKAMIAGSDCLVSLHRAEGLGLDMLDALAQGTPVVATAYSGNMDYCDAETTWLVDYALVPVPSEDYAFVEPGHVWAAPLLASAVDALRGVVGDAGRRAARAEMGRQRMCGWWSPNAFSARLSHEIGERLLVP